MFPSLTTTTLREADGPLVLLGPSLGTGGERLWAPVVPLLGERARIVVWDLPGHGNSPTAQRGSTVADLADAVAEIAAAIDAPYAVHAGVSLGGATGLELGLRHAVTFSALAVLCSGAALGTPSAWHERAALVREHGTAAVVAGSEQRWFAPGFVAAQPEAAGGLLEALPGVDAESYARCCEALADYDVSADLGRITDPVLAVAGADDQVAPPALADRIARDVRRGRSVTLPGVAHLAPTEDPAATAELLISLLEDPSGDPPPTLRPSEETR